MPWSPIILIYINNLPRALRNCKVTMYADDTSLSFASNNIDDLIRFMNEDLNCLKDCLQENKLSLNVLKTHAMVVGSRPKLKRIADEVSGQPSFFINGTQIETVERTKYLGFQLDCHLVWDEHIKCMKTKVSRALGFLKYAKKFLPRTRSVKCTEESLNPTFAIVAQYGDVAAKLKLITYKNCKIELPELLLIAAFVFQQLI